MKNAKKIALSAMAFFSLPLLSFAEGKAIYGSDNRFDFYEAPAGIQALSNSVVSLWKSEKVKANHETGRYDLTTLRLGVRELLCPGNRFWLQKTGAYCSGALVGPDLVLTAGHCIKNAQDCANTRIVFGFKAAKDGDNGPDSIDKREVYGCSSIVKRTDDIAEDFAVIKLDRKVTGHKPLLINRGVPVKEGKKLFMIGYPTGLPLKVADGAKVTKISIYGTFATDLDGFGGNSGSPIFNASTYKIEGVLTLGTEDYKVNYGCSNAATYAQNDDPSEEAVYISKAAPYIPLLPGEAPQPVQCDVTSTDADSSAAPLRVPAGFDGNKN